MVGYGGSSASSYLADPTSPIPSHCASVVTTSTLGVKCHYWDHPGNRKYVLGFYLGIWTHGLPFRAWGHYINCRQNPSCHLPNHLPTCPSRPPGKARYLWSCELHLDSSLHLKANLDIPKTVHKHYQMVTRYWSIWMGYSLDWITCRSAEILFIICCVHTELTSTFINRTVS